MQRLVTSLGRDNETLFCPAQHKEETGPATEESRGLGARRGTISPNAAGTVSTRTPSAPVRSTCVAIGLDILDSTDQVQFSCRPTRTDHRRGSKRISDASLSVHSMYCTNRGWMSLGSPGGIRSPTLSGCLAAGLVCTAGRPMRVKVAIRASSLRPSFRGRWFPHSI